jgi:hypothetical protein
MRGWTDLKGSQEREGNTAFQGMEFEREVKMISEDSNTSQGCFGLMKWLIGAGLGLIAAGGSVVAILEFFKPDPVYSPAQNTVIVVPATNVPTPGPADITPEEWQAVEEFLSLAIVSEITAYEYGDPSYATTFSGGAMETIQSQIADLNSRGVLLMAQFDPDNSYIYDIRVTPTSKIEVDSCEYWTHDYFDRQTGTFIDSDPWELVPQTITIEELNENFYITSIAFYTGQAFCN